MTGGRRRLAALRKEYDRAWQSGDPVPVRSILEQVTADYPDQAWAWFDLGLLAKRERRWQECADLNRRALDLEHAGGSVAEEPAAWNLGIAATALGDWRSARSAWSAYGLPIELGDQPIMENYGVTPIRLNPEPRHLGETQLALAGRTYAPEVVWCTRICPARARIENVPTPESGHRFGDLVLHDGEPVGERRLGDGVRSVFAELTILIPSSHPTSAVEVQLPDPAAAQDLEDVFDAAGLRAEPSSNLQLLCRACSEGRVASDHDHHRPSAAEIPGPQQFLVAGDAESTGHLLQDWSRRGDGRSVLDVRIATP